MKRADKNIRITVLGSGTSTGVPLIGCSCKVCTSDNRKNRRTRSSIMISLEDSNILIDTSTDLRYQALKNGITRVDAVLFTHAHADHIHGIDELRSFNFLQKSAIPCYGSALTLERIKSMFSYIFTEHSCGGGVPRLTMNEAHNGLEILGMEITPIEVLHGELPILGYRFANVAYITDCSFIPEASLSKLEGLELLILGALRHTPHSTHFSLDEALAVTRKLSPGRTLFTHMGHDLDYEVTTASLPEGVGLAWDGMTIDIKIN